jgi:subtilase family serine protease
MFRGCARWLVACLVVLFSFGSAHALHASSVPGMVRLPGHVLPALAKATIVPSNPKDENAPITLTLVLRRDNQPAFDAYLRDLYDPHSKNFHKFLTQRQIADRFGPSRQVYDRTLRHMRANGFALVAGSKNRLTLTMRGTRRDAERAFDVRIGDYKVGNRVFYATNRDPALPMRLAGRVQSVAGLSDLAAPIRTAESTDAAGALAGPDWQLTQTICFPFTPITGINFIGVLEAAYLSITIRLEAAPLFAAACTGFFVASGFALGTCNALGVANPSIWTTSKQCAEFAAAGAGPSLGDRPAMGSSVRTSPATGFANPQKIGLLEFDTFNPTDVHDWLEFIGGGATFEQLSEVPVNGGVPSPGPNEPEVLLDVDTVMEIAPLPGNTYVVYDAPSGTNFQTMFNKMVDDGDTVISNSWTQCENQTSQADAQSVDTILQGAAASGISVINGSGDTGSTCLDGATNTIGVPSDSPNATAVGGTTPIPGPGLTYGSETWWNGVDDVPPTGQGGFGVSEFFTRPSYQNGLTGSAMRSVPDVVVDADPQQGLLLCQADAGGCPSGPRYGGTSMAAQSGRHISPT